MAIATLYFIGPLGNFIELAFSLTTESKPVDKIAPNHSPFTKPKSIALGAVETIISRYGPISSSDQPKVRTKSFPVPAGIIARGICAGVVIWRMSCVRPSPPTAITPSHSG